MTVASIVFAQSPQKSGGHRSRNNNLSVSLKKLGLQKQFQVIYNFVLFWST